MSDRSTHALQTVPLKKTGVICDFRFFFFIICIPEKVTVPSVPGLVQPAWEACRRKYDDQMCCSFVHRTAPSRDQRKISLISWCQVILDCRGVWLKGAKAKICLKFGSSTANFSNTIQEDKNSSACKQLKRQRKSEALYLQQEYLAEGSVIGLYACF